MADGMTGAAALLLGVAALVLAAVGGWPLTAAVLHLAARSPDSGGTADQRTSDASGDGAGPDDASTLRGGTWIGVLERLAVAGALIAGYPSGIALVIAVKGLGRYPELREHPDASERFVIGTFTSMLWACAVGLGARVLLA